MAGTQRKDLAVPADKVARDEIRCFAETYCAGQSLVPPLAIDEIETHASHILDAMRLEPSFRGFVNVMVWNALWRDTVAGIPFERRILLLPQCIHSSSACPAKLDALGLLCEECGRCTIGKIQREAEELGYMVLVAEGTTAVSALLARGEADAVIGVSCLDALEKSFHPMSANAIPGLAVPLLRNGCVDTVVDLEFVHDILHLRAGARPASARVDMAVVRREVCDWFEPSGLEQFLKPESTETESLAISWLAKGGKRWRPTLTVSVFKALTEQSAITPESLKKVAIAVECFHKASLVHDDIEDADDLRYGAPTMHREHGIAVALNIGDLLIGDGYRLIAGSGLSDEQVQQMITVASEGHRTLCIGQGAELLCRNVPEYPGVDAVIEIHRRKTAPAFNVALQLGAICAGADNDTRAILAEFSESLGVAYQIRDDMDDATADQSKAPGTFSRPSLVLAVVREEQRRAVAVGSPAVTEEVVRTRAEQRVQSMLLQYETQARNALRPLRQAPLKTLLYRVIAKILVPTTKP